MSFTRLVLAAFVGGVLAGVFLLAYRASKETGKSIPGSLADVPGEAQRVYGDVRTRAAEVVSDGREAFREKQDAVMEYVKVARGKESEAEPDAEEQA